MMKRIRHTEMSDLPKVLAIYERARQFMQESGNPYQWQSNYPEDELVIADIENRNSYVCLNKKGEIAGVFFFMKDEEDPTYLKIYEGEWFNNEAYGVIHRIASAGGERGVLRAAVEWGFQQCPNLRIDTHRDNSVMQKALEKLGFLYCGVIYLENGDERLAYQISL